LMPKVKQKPKKTVSCSSSITQGEKGNQREAVFLIPF
jgi:hypothetical protein